MEYVYIVIDNREFFTGKPCIVGVSEKFDYISQYKEPAFKAACKQLGVSESDSCVSSFMFLGHDLHFVNIPEVQRSKSRIVRKLFECTTKGSSDKRNPIAVVMEELNNTVDADNVVFIDERSGVGHFISDESEIGGGYFPRFAKLLVFYREDVDEEETN